MGSLRPFQATVLEIASSAALGGGGPRQESTLLWAGVRATPVAGVMGDGEVTTELGVLMPHEHHKELSTPGGPGGQSCRMSAASSPGSLLRGPTCRETAMLGVCV